MLFRGVSAATLRVAASNLATGESEGWHSITAEIDGYRSIGMRHSLSQL
jgi:hypothetical protein